MDIGGNLRRARTNRNLSLADISQRTKISPSVLRAIEANQFESVPGGLFARNFLKAYAREVELDPEPIVQSYRSEFEAPQVQGDAEATEGSGEPDPDFVAPINRSRGPSETIGLAVVVLVGLACLGALRGLTSSSSAAATRPTDAVESSAAAMAPVPVATSGALDTARDTSGNAPLKVEIQVSGPCWVAAPRTASKSPAGC